MILTDISKLQYSIIMFKIVYDSGLQNLQVTHVLSGMRNDYSENNTDNDKSDSGKTPHHEEKAKIEISEQT